MSNELCIDSVVCVKDQLYIENAISLCESAAALLGLLLEVDSEIDVVHNASVVGLCREQ